MTLALSLMLILTISSVNPISMATSLMLASIMMTPYIYKNLASSWIPLILILTFSSGMMTLFMYTASLASNETNKKKKKLYPLLILLLTPPMMQQKKTQSTMKTFSSHSSMLILATILMITLVALTSQAHNPNQALNSSF